MNYFKMKHLKKYYLKKQKIILTVLEIYLMEIIKDSLNYYL